MPTRKPAEILAPVADFDMLKAAVHNGAGAVYIGLPGFNARGRSSDLSMDEIREMAEYCHLYGLKLFGALNILIFETELHAVKSLVIESLQAGVDALIVQDLGLASMIHQLSDDISLHASTQMTVASSEAIACLNDLGFERYILARECSLEEILKIREQTEKELEVFVHGALCISYSGQCLASEMMFNRSANRGQCAQSCRLEYNVEVDGQIQKGAKAVFSPKDLAGISAIDTLKSSGIDSFKIEGRLKSAEYVAAVCRMYSENQILPEMDVLFSRGKSVGWLQGQKHKGLMNLEYSHHRGMKIGKVIERIKKAKFPSLSIETRQEIQPGDSLLFVKDNLEITGGKIYEIQRKGKILQVTFSKDVSLKQVETDSEVYWNSSSTLDKKIQQSWKNKELMKKVPVQMRITGQLGAPLRLELSDDQGNWVQAETELLLEPAKQSGLDETSMKKVLGGLGGTAFQLDSLSRNLDDNLFIHNRELKQIKRDCIAQLEEKRVQVRVPELKALSVVSKTKKDALPDQPQELSILVRSIQNFQKLEAAGVKTVYLDFPGIRNIRNAGRELRKTGLKLGLTTPRIFKGNETSYLTNILKFKPDVLLVRSPGAWQWILQSGLLREETELVADFSFNITNHLSAEWLLKKGMNRLTPAYDLNKDQLLDFAKATKAASLECILHASVPVFHMEYCVYANQLGKGENIDSCGMPCMDHKIRIYNEKQQPLRMEVDSFCRNTASMEEAISYSELIPDFKKLGVRYFRLEWAGGDEEELFALTDYYLEALNMDTTDRKLVELKRRIHTEVSSGMLFKADNYQDKKKNRV